jgi:hypothetical protein
MAGAGYVIWDVAAAVVRTVQLVANASKATGVEARADEIGVLMASFSHMLTTIEDQATQINTFRLSSIQPTKTLKPRIAA